MLVTALQAHLKRPLVVVTPSPERARELADGLRFFGRGAVASYTAPDTSPYRQMTPNRFAVMARVATLYRLTQASPPAVLVLPAEALRPRTIPRAVLGKLLDFARAGETLDRDAFVLHLDEMGYGRVPVVEDPGTYAVRGGIVDVWSPLYEQPIRIDLFGDMVESLRYFDAETQRSAARTTTLICVPASEVLIGPQTLNSARSVLRTEAAEAGIPAPQVRAILAELDDGIRPLGVEGWLPAFYDSVETVADYIPDRALWLVEDPGAVEAAIEAQMEALQAGYEEARAKGRLVFPPPGQLGEGPPVRPDLALLSIAYSSDLASSRVIELRFEQHLDLRRELDQLRGEDHAFRPAADRIRGWLRKGLRVIAVGGSMGHAERIRGLLGHYELRGRIVDEPLDLVDGSGDADVELRVGDLEHGFVFQPLGLAILGTADLIPQQKRAARRSRARAIAAATLASFRDLTPGDLLVHTEHGIGRYDGLHKLVVAATPGDYLKVHYRGDDVLYLPVHRLDNVSKYVAGEDAAPALDRLGGVTWEKKHARAKIAARSIAKELIAIAAARRARIGHAYQPTGEYFEEFSASFAHEVTPDQAQAIDDVMEDMDAARPMDRLVCGDVGYGKTEVAMRAAFRAILDGKQVAVLVPTTVLCEQHRLTFEDRFRGYPVTIAALSRFRSRKEEKAILDRLRTGRLDIVIGTHRLLSKDVVYSELGLLVIDEEHRFGVRHKERIKQVRELVEVLTLTATPIPRTLNMALSGLRDMSIIATPPTDRLAVRTLVSRVSDDVIEEALSAELKRGGQIYVVHNRVGTIHRFAERIQRLMPRARIVVGHGQMAEQELEQVMLAFMAGEADVLVCTTIIESGLDIPRANTMLIHRADQLGLAQLYQLRGRVGRSRERAFCYLLIPEPKNLAGLAQKRVAAIQRFSDLGSGFHIASMDMELRGTGNLLGRKQHGHVKEVGLELFLELLEDAVAELKGTPEDKLGRLSTEMKIQVPAFLPESYVPDINLRLWFYKRIASARTTEQLDDAFEDLADRCGRLPEEASNLYEVTELKIDCQRLGARSFSFSPGGVVLALDEASPLAGAQVVALVSRPGARWRLTPEIELIRGVTQKEWDAGLEAAREAVRELLNYAGARGLLTERDRSARTPE